MALDRFVRHSVAPRSVSTRSASSLLGGSTIRAITRSRYTTSPTSPEPSQVYTTLPWSLRATCTATAPEAVRTFGRYATARTYPVSTQCTHP